jgi:RecJ-like exonuclease
MAKEKCLNCNSNGNELKNDTQCLTCGGNGWIGVQEEEKETETITVEELAGKMGIPFTRIG